MDGICYKIGMKPACMEEIRDMQVGATKKLLDYMHVKAGPADTAIDPMLRWSANIITINHRRAVILCNDSSRYGYILYGIRKKDIEAFPGLILDGIRACFEAECIAPDLIEKYLAECGSDVIYTKTANRSVTASLTMMCQHASFMAEHFTSEHILQKHILQKLNSWFILLKDDPEREYVSINEKLAEDFSDRYGVTPYRCRAAEFEVELKLESTCRRRIIVPLSYSFRQFHHILQKLFSWENYHLHDFWIEFQPNGRNAYTITGSPRQYNMADEITRPDHLVLLSEIFPQHEHIIYNYDVGDNWNHHIRLINIIDDYDKNHAVCISGEGDAPPEDSGGAPGYAHMLQVLADPDNPDYEDMKLWYEGTRCSPFDIDAVNRSLKYFTRLQV